VSLFNLDPVRRSIRRQGDQLAIGDETHSSEALARAATERPAAFSPNVLLRPIVQDTLFPTVAYIAGPSELAYLGQLRAVYEAFGVPMPLMVPRSTATLLDSGATRFLEKYKVAFEDLRKPDESTLNRLLEAQLPASVEQSLKDAVAQTQQAMGRVIEALPALDPTLQGAAKTTLGKIEHELRALHSKVIHAAKKRDETLRRQFTRAQAQAFPHGHPQERTLAVIYFLNRYGPGLIDLLLDELPIDPGHHSLVTL
jgi:bacillithiol synthase